MIQIHNKSETQQDLFAFIVHEIAHPKTPGTWVDIGARNFGAGFGQNNTEFLYEQGWSGLSMDISDFGDSYKHLDTTRVAFEQIDCTNPELLLSAINKYSIPKRINYLSFDIDDATEQGLVALGKIIDEEGYTFDSITFENDSYRFNTRVRDIQRSFFIDRGYVLAAELDLYEDWWIHKTIYSERFQPLQEIKHKIKHNSGFNYEDLSYLHNVLVGLL